MVEVFGCYRSFGFTVEIQLASFQNNPSAGLADISLFVVILLLKLEALDFLFKIVDPDLRFA